MFREGLLVVVSGPSGAGKGTVLSALRQMDTNVRYSVSATTRQPRAGEIEGQNYFFKTVETFKRMIENDELVEWVQYCDNFYGTPREYVQDCTKAGNDVILEIEVEGALNIKDRFPECVSIFIMPPSYAELRKRIEGRGTEKPEVIEKRLEKARKELMLVDKYDYIVVNDDVEKAASRIESILVSEKLRFFRNRSILDEIGI